MSNFKSVKPKLEQGDVVQIKSDEWYVWDDNSWREMTVDEQLEYSK